MDTNSRIIAESKTKEEQNLEKFFNGIDKLKKFKKIFYMVIGLAIVFMILVNPIKKLAIVISLFIVMIFLCIERMIQDFRDIGIFQEIYQIANTTENVAEILEKTNNDNGVEKLLGKHHRNIIDNLYKVEKLMYSSIINGKQSESLANELVVDVSKNLKNPVENIKIYVKELENIDKQNDKLLLNKLEKEAHQLKHNIEELFELAKAMTNSIDLYMQDIDINNLARQALVEYEEKLENNNLRLVTNIQSGKVLINADGQQMWRVFEILLDNVVKYSKENSRVYLNVCDESDEIVISLINISKDELNIDINTFYESIRENQGKNKLGLAIAKNLIDIQNGNMDVVIDGDMFKVDIRFVKIKEDEE